MSTVLLLAGAALLVTWLVSPADSAPPAQAPVARTPLDDAAPLLADVNSEVERLHDRVPTPPRSSVPTRDLFSYGHHPVSNKPTPTGVGVIATPVTLVPPPTLVAILAGDGIAPRRAVFSSTDTADVQFLVTGGTIGRFVVGEIQDDVVVLTDRRTDEILRLTLR